MVYYLLYHKLDKVLVTLNECVGGYIKILYYFALYFHIDLNSGLQSIFSVMLIRISAVTTGRI